MNRAINLDGPEPTPLAKPRRARTRRRVEQPYHYQAIHEIRDAIARAMSVPVHILHAPPKQLYEEPVMTVSWTSDNTSDAPPAHPNARCVVMP